jgi:hypothetical protein
MAEWKLKARQTLARYETVFLKSKAKGLGFPREALYGRLGEIAQALGVPLGWGYPAILTAFAPLCRWKGEAKVRPTLYTTLIGPVHSGRTEVIKRAVASIRYPRLTVCKTVPGSDRGVISLFGGRVKNDDDELPEPKYRLLYQDELRNLLAKTDISGSSLPATLCTLWSDDEAGASDKLGYYRAVVRLSILGALKADDVDDFASVFGRNTTAGLYDRFLLGVTDEKWEYSPLHIEPKVIEPGEVEIAADAFEMLADWRRVDPKGRGRLAEIGLRVAYISALGNGDQILTEESLLKALLLMEWQERVRQYYLPGLGDGLDAQATNAILNALGEKPGQWFYWRRLSTARNWYRKFGSRTISMARECLYKTGITREELDEGSRRTGRLMLIPTVKAELS